jgi:hypothetical protein
LDGFVNIEMDHERADACLRAKRLADCMPGNEALMRFMTRAAQTGDMDLVVALGLIIAGREPTPEQVGYLLRE